MWQYNYTNELYHHGIKGQKWGVRRFQNKDGTLTSEGKRHYNTESDGKSSYFTDEQKAKAIGYAKTGAKIAAGITVAYGAHKLINDPRVLQSGMNIAKNVNSKYGSMKTSAIDGFKNTTEFKVLSKAAGMANGAKDAGAKAVNFISDDKTRKFILGIGTMAGTAGVIKTQVKDLKSSREYNDNIDKSLDYIKRYSDIGVNVTSLAKGPMNQNYNNNNYGSNKGNNNSTNKALVKARNFKEIVGNPKGGQRTPEQEKEYQSFFDGADEETRGIIKAMRRNDYSNEQIKQIIQHSDLIYGESLYHHGIKGQKWGVRRFQNPDGTLTSEGRKKKSTRTEIKDRYFAFKSNWHIKSADASEILKEHLNNNKKYNDIRKIQYGNNEKMKEWVDKSNANYDEQIKKINDGEKIHRQKAHDYLSRMSEGHMIGSYEFRQAGWGDEIITKVMLSNTVMTSKQFDKYKEKGRTYLYDVHLKEKIN